MWVRACGRTECNHASRARLAVLHRGRLLGVVLVDGHNELALARVDADDVEVVDLHAADAIRLKLHSIKTQASQNPISHL